MQEEVKKVRIKRVNKIDFREFVLDKVPEVERVVNLWFERMHLCYELWYRRGLYKGKIGMMEGRLKEIDDEIRNSKVWELYQKYSQSLVRLKDNGLIKGKRWILDDGWDEYRVGAFISRLKDELVFLKGKDLVVNVENDGGISMSDSKKEIAVEQSESLFEGDERFEGLKDEIFKKAENVEGKLMISRLNLAEVLGVSREYMKRLEMMTGMRKVMCVNRGSCKRVYYELDYLFKWMKENWDIVVKVLEGKGIKTIFSFEIKLQRFYMDLVEVLQRAINELFAKMEVPFAVEIKLVERKESEMNE